MSKTNKFKKINCIDVIIFDQLKFVFENVLCTRYICPYYIVLYGQ